MKNGGIIYLKIVCAENSCVFANVYRRFDGKRFEGEPKCGVGISLKDIAEKFNGDGCDKSAIAVSTIVGVDPASQEWIARQLDILVRPANHRHC